MNEALRIVADWLGDPTNGINALLPAVPRDVGDAQPPNVTIQDETRHNRPARGRIPKLAATTPVVMLGAEQLQGPQEFVTDDGYFVANLSLLYAWAGSDDAYVITQAGFYSLRAAWWSLRRFRKLEVNNPARKRNGIILFETLQISLNPWVLTETDTLLVGGLLLSISGRDSNT